MLSLDIWFFPRHLCACHLHVGAETPEGWGVGGGCFLSICVWLRSVIPCHMYHLFVLACLC